MINLKINKDIKNLLSVNYSRCRLITFVNPYSYYILKDKHDELVNEMSFVFADGIFLVKMYNFFNRTENINRYSFDFTSLAPIVFDYSIKNSLKVALVGGNSAEISKACQVLNEKFPLLNIVYSRNGFFENELQRKEALNELNSHHPDILICGMGTPLQEVFIIQASQKASSLKYCFTCGGFLSQISSRDDYFNPLLNKFNLRWLQRAYRHSYVRKRLFFDYPIFFVRFLIDKLFK